MRDAEYVFVNFIKALFFFLIVFMAYSKFCLKDLAKQTYAKICFSPNMASVTSVNMLQLTYVWGKVVDKINIYLYTFFLRFSFFEVVLRLLGAVKVVNSGARLHTYVMTTYDRSSAYRRVC
jgi:hypothetical protein